MPYLLIHKHGLCLLKPVKGIGCLWIACLIWMDEEGFDAVAFLDVGFGHARFEVEDGVRVEFEGFNDAVDFGILGEMST